MGIPPAARRLMEKISTRKRGILDALDEAIADLEKKLAKAQPLFDELGQLKKTRATLLNERTTTGGINSKTQLTMEMVIQFFRDRDNKWAQPQELADALSVPSGTVRSHFARGKETRYEYDANQGWRLYGEPDGDDGDE